MLNPTAVLLDNLSAVWNLHCRIRLVTVFGLVSG